jgi:hypothetical protein
MMRKTLLFLVAATLGTTATGCEDNPDQFYKRAPAGAGDRWNNGKTPPTYDRDAKNGFTDQFNSSSKQDLCSGAEKHDRWAKMVREPIVPPRKLAGIDLAGGDDWKGLDFRDAEKVLCQSKSRAIGDPENLGAAWGDANEVEVDYSMATNTITNWQLNPGYRGKLEFESRPEGLADNGFADAAKRNPWGVHKFSISIGTQIQKDGRPHEIHWNNDCKPDNKPGDLCWQLELTEMYDALMFTYSKDLMSTQGNCVLEQKCLGSKARGDIGLFGVRPLGTYLVVPNYRTQPAASTPAYFYGFYVKLMPFSGAELYVKLDDEGPWAFSAAIGENKKDCKQFLGVKYGDFVANCININKAETMHSSGQPLNQFILGKFKGGMSRTKEAFDFSVEAVSLNFLSTRIGDDKTVGDDWTPTDSDFAHEWEMDIRASGKVLNEWSADKKSQTMAATGAIYREYARRVQADINAKLAEWLPEKAPLAATNGQRNIQCAPGYEPTSGGKCHFKGFGIGDSRCLMNAGDTEWKPAEGCTGFEGFITPGDRDHVNLSAYPPGSDPLRVSFGWRGAQLGIKTALKAGDPLAIFCNDPPTNGAGKDQAADGTPAQCTDDNACFSSKCNAAKKQDKAKQPKPEAGCPEGWTDIGGNTCQQNACPDGWTDIGENKCQQNVRFCENPLKTHCQNQYDDGSGNKVFSASHKRVIDTLGKGDELKVPPALRDRKFYFRHLAAAIVKYLKAAPKDPTMEQPKDLADPDFMPGGRACLPKDAAGNVLEEEPWNCEPEPDHLLFDQMIANSDRDKFEYIDRRYARDGKEPLKVEYEVLINSSNQQDWKYHRKLTRPERALYKYMETAKASTDPNYRGDPDNLRLTNLVGSAILAQNFAGVSATKDAHYCASTLLPAPPPGKTCLDEGFCKEPDPDCSSTPPMANGQFMLDDYHMPLLKNYRGGFAGSGTAFGIGTSYIKLVQELPLIKSARVALPLFDDPYAPVAPGPGIAAGNAPILIADWRPKTPANGIRIPVNEQLDKFIPSATVVFGGSSLTLDLDYVETPEHTMRLEAVNSDSYMGNIFLCVDPNSGDLLSIEQYESMDVIQGWLNGHPGAREACGIMTRFSAFGDYPQMLHARVAGIVLDVGLGSGVGRITSVQIYDTTLE